MGMTMSEKILAKHAGLERVEAGQLVTCKLDMVLANDITAPPSIKIFESIGRPVFDNEKIALVPDHFQPAKDIKSAELAKSCGILRSSIRLCITSSRGVWGLNMLFCRKKVLWHRAC